MRMAVSLHLPRESASVARARHVLDVMLAEAHVSDDQRASLGLLISEACTNAVVHARRDGPIEITLRVENDECVVEVGNTDGDMAHLGLTGLTGLPPDPLEENGRGLPLIAAIADTARFINPRPGWVVLQMAKRLPVPPAPAGAT